MYGPENLPWRDDPDQWREDLARSGQAEGLRRHVVDQLVSISLATHLEMGEKAIEGLIDTMWNGMRKGILPDNIDYSDPRRVNLDLILEAWMTVMIPEVNDKVGDILHKLECPVHGFGAGTHDREYGDPLDKIEWQNETITWTDLDRKDFRLD